MKKTVKFLTSALLLLTVNTYADSTERQQEKNANDMMAPYNPASSVFLSSPDYTFEAEFSALFLQPSGSNLHYAAEAIPLPIEKPHWKIFNIHPDYHFGFDVGVGGIFHTLNTSLTLNWTRFRSTDSNSKKVPSTDMIGPFYEIGPDASTKKSARGHVAFHFDGINLDYGLFVNFGDRLRTNLFAGVGFARIKQTLRTKFFSPGASTTNFTKVPSTFIGAGPQLGIDFTYRLISGFHLSGETCASLFVGTQKNHTNFKSVFPTGSAFPFPSPNKQNTRDQKRTQVVPGFAGKLGLAYFYDFRKRCTIQLEAGYEANIFLNAIQSTDIGSEVVTPPITPDTIGVFARTFQRSVSNFSLAGPYVTLNLGF